MELLFLGTGAGSPTKTRNTSSLVLKLLDEINENWLFDCGEGTQHQILRTSIKPRKITKIFITHLHGDHIFGLPGFLSSRNFQGGNQEITIYGPRGIKEFVNTTLRISKTKLQYMIHFIEIDAPSGLLFEDKKFKVFYMKLDHGIDSYAYKVVEKDQAGQLLIEELAAFNIPNGPILGQLKRGEIVELADGTRLNGKDFIGPDKVGKSIVIFGDTRYREEFIDFVKGANYLVYEATFAGDEEQMAYNYFHSTLKQACHLAKVCQVDLLFMNHISSRYVGPEYLTFVNQTQALFDQAVVVRDFDEFKL